MGLTLPLAGASHRRRPSPPEFSRSTLPSPLSGDSLMPSEPLKTLPNTVRNCTFTLPSLLFNFVIFVCFHYGVFCRHNTRQRILQQVKDTSAKLKSLSESDRDANSNVCFSFLVFLVFVYPFFFFYLCFICVTLNFDYLQLIIPWFSGFSIHFWPCIRCSPIMFCFFYYALKKL